MKLVQKSQKLICQKYRYVRHYFSNLLTTLRWVQSSLKYSSDQLSHDAVEQFQRLATLLQQNQKIFTQKGRDKEHQKQYALLTNIVKALVDQLFSKKILRKSDDLLQYYVGLLDYNHRLYQDLDSLWVHVEKMAAGNQHFKPTNQIAHLFWMTEMKGLYIVYVREVWEKLLKFLRKLQLFTPLLSQFNQKTICQRLDPNKQYFISANTLSDLFLYLSQPQAVKKLLDETTITKQVFEWKTARQQQNLRMRFINKMDVKGPLKNNDVLEINADKVIMNDGSCQDVKYPNVLTFGSSPRNDIQIVHSCISRSQFIIVSENGYNIVCTSPSNSTRIVYQSPTQLKEGMMFKIGEVQLFSVYKLIETEETMFECEQTDKTVTHLPEKFKKIKVSKLQLQILRGKMKDKTVELRIDGGENRKVYKIGKNQEVYCESEGLIEAHDGHFYVSSNAEILLKNVWEYSSLKPSSKTRLSRGDKIYSEQYEFQVF